MNISLNLGAGLTDEIGKAIGVIINTDGYLKQRAMQGASAEEIVQIAQFLQAPLKRKLAARRERLIATNDP